MTKVTFKPDISKFIQDVRNIIDDPIMRRHVLESASKALAMIASGRPQEGPWNKSPGSRGDNRWYQRGFGTRWMRKDGTLNGIQNSQDLQRSWRNEIVDEFTASTFTEVTYAPQIHDPQQRVNWAALHGWKTTDELVDIFAPKFEEIALKELEAKIGGL